MNSNKKFWLNNQIMIIMTLMKKKNFYLLKFQTILFIDMYSFFLFC